MRLNISVILPIYNVSAYLSRCLDSILETGYQDLEIICVNDGSKDDSLRILRQYEAADSRIRVIDKENGGVSSARNAGLSVATGDYVSFVDPDDFIHPRYFEILSSCASEHDADYVIGGFRSIKEENTVSDPPVWELGSFSSKQLSVLEFFRSHGPRTYIWGRLLRRTVASAVRFDEVVRIGEDGLYNSDICISNPDLRIWHVDAPIYGYLQREGSAMSRAKDAELFRVAEEYEKRISDLNVTELACLIPAIRRGLTVRYYATHIHPDPDLAKRCRVLLKRCAKRLFNAQTISRKEKLVDWSMIGIPGLYWLYRARQPGMWKWERVERKKRRDEKKRKNEALKKFIM